jgi:hypothetical protein
MVPQIKTVTAIIPISKTAAATATGEAIDTLGYRYCVIHVMASTADVVSNKPTVLKVQESATTDATNFADVSGLVGGTDFTVTNSLTSLPNNYQFGINLGVSRKRYLRALVSPATTQVIAGSAVLMRGEEAPSTAAKSGVLNLVTI